MDLLCLGHFLDWQVDNIVSGKQPRSITFLGEDLFLVFLIYLDMFGCWTF